MLILQYKENLRVTHSWVDEPIIPGRCATCMNYFCPTCNLYGFINCKNNIFFIYTDRANDNLTCGEMLLDGVL